MFDQIERRKDISKSAYKAEVADLRNQLVVVQQALRHRDFPVIVVFAGVDGAGKHETVDLLNAWMDPRWLQTHAYGEPSDEERERPGFWRFWRDLPPNGIIGLYLSAWYSRPLLARVKERCSESDFSQRIEEINAFERTLIANGALILKYWMHLDKRSQRKRLESLSANRLTSWEVKPKDWEHWALYDRFIEVSRKLIRSTDMPDASWQMIDSSPERRRSLDVARSVLQSCNARLEQEHLEAVQTPPFNATPSPAALESLDLNRPVSRNTYKHELTSLHARLGPLQRAAREAGISTVLVFEGWDAAGKGGAIRRITNALDARHYQVIPIAAPTDEEHAHHYLWRFWRHLPRAGRITIFDRSWYGRVLVERIEGFCTDAAWQRAYREMNDFETTLAGANNVVCKFWVHISKEEQLNRFRERESIPYKSWKLTDEDWRNRERWDEYVHAVNDMVHHTDTEVAPWTLVEGNDKYFARLKVLRTVCDRLEAALGWINESQAAQ